MKKLVADGLIGQPLYGEAGFFRIGDWGERGMSVDDPNAKPGKDLNWEAFLGDSPKRPFSVDRFFRWRLFEDYAGGPVTDLYPHSLTQVVDILGVGFPESVVALGGIHRYEYELREVPDSFDLIAQYPEKVTITLMGTQANDYNTTDKRGSGKRSPVIRGWDGTLFIHENKEIMFTPVRVKGAKPPQRFAIEHGEDNFEHWRNLIQCSRTRNKNTWSPIDLAFRTQTVLQMSMLAYRKGKTARFDPVRKEIRI
jgi:predicted dehydrogenase